MIGRRIKDLRTKNSMSIRKLSAISGVSKSYISKIENGDVKSIGTATAHKLALALKAKPCEFVVNNYSCLYFVLPPRWRKHSKKIEKKFLDIMQKDDISVNKFMEKFISLLNEYVEK